MVLGIKTSYDYGPMSATAAQTCQKPRLWYETHETHTNLPLFQTCSRHEEFRVDNNDPFLAHINDYI